MADSTTTTGAPATTTAPTPTGTPADNGATATDALPVKLFATKAEAEAARPANASKNARPFEVSKCGSAVGWVLARGYDHGLAVVARSEGFTVSTGNSAPVTVEAAAAKLATLSDADLAALGLTRKPVKGGKKS